MTSSLRHGGVNECVVSEVDAVIFEAAAQATDVAAIQTFQRSLHCSVISSTARCSAESAAGNWIARSTIAATDIITYKWRRREWAAANARRRVAAAKVSIHPSRIAKYRTNSVAFVS